ncbi:hypothetical protein HanRHA438_Chr08g0355911 [Helianthus annuus]|nr:hypothetical protein HanRHA438_Chr08g0355911 [Helianthus annuus]
MLKCKKHVIMLLVKFLGCFRINYLRKIKINQGNMIGNKFIIKDMVFWAFYWLLL